MIHIEQEGKVELISLEELSKRTGATFIPQLDYENFSVLANIGRRAGKLHKKGELTREQLWLGAYFRHEILHPPIPDVVIRYINPILGWGVFANRDFKKMEYISEYAGKLRKKRRIDRKNAYCFEYILAPGHPTPYTIDARDQGGIGRYINHSHKPNLLSALATVENISHVILITNEEIPKGAQLCFDYGPDYWATRTAPV